MMRHRSFFSRIGDLDPDPLFILLCDPFPDPDPPFVTDPDPLFPFSRSRSMIVILPINV